MLRMVRYLKGALLHALIAWLGSFFTAPLANCMACGTPRCRETMFRVRGVGRFCNPSEFNAWTRRSW